MAEPKMKGPALEKAIARLAGQMDKTVAKRQWSAAAHASLLTYLAEAHGAKFPSAEARNALRADLMDGDCSFSSNMKKYWQARGLLPKGDEYTAPTFE